MGTDVPQREHHRPTGMGPHICAVVQRGASSASEHIVPNGAGETAYIYSGDGTSRRTTPAT